MAKQDYYDILGVEKNCDEKTLKSAFRKLAKQYHPDHNSGNPEAEAKFKEVAEAYQVLTNKYIPQQEQHPMYHMRPMNPNDLFTHLFNHRAGFINLGRPHMFHQNMPGGVQIHVQNAPINQSSVTTHIINGQKIETITEICNGIVRKKTRITKL